MTVHTTLHLRYEIDREYVSRKEEGELRILQINQLDDYIKENKERLITAVSNSNVRIRTRKGQTDQQQKLEKL